jgi:hypothetical protein
MTEKLITGKREPVNLADVNSMAWWQSQNWTGTPAHVKSEQKATTEGAYGKGKSGRAGG